MNEISILLATFASVLIASVLTFNYVASRREVRARLTQATSDASVEELPITDLRGLPITEAELLRNYFAVVRSDKDPNSLQNRLICAGYFSPNAVRVFQLIRVLVSLAVFSSVVFGASYFFPELSRLSLLIYGLFPAGFAFFLCAVVLEMRGNKCEVIYRRLFPDFMDMLIVCVDAGMSVEAAIDRVSKEFLKSTSKDFGLHLAIMMLEMRGGRRLRDALALFSKRLRIEEAQALATLFRQSEELGASVTKTLRVFSQEMRDKRMIRAEEKANALPFKMLLPLAGFLFPISVLIVLVPILMRVISLLKSMAPG
ncbi:type II secretion system F family protein [Aquamicrobium soli]|uniref:Type II secretion system F family protein n=1 Tax=Aquamicrobium soli TaxID=1811518 RepID=A0ABV7K6E0_9HYPH